MSKIIRYQALSTSQPEEQIRLFYRLKFQLRKDTLALTEKEIHLATIETQIYQVEKEYFAIVGKLFIDLDEINAQIAEFLANQNPDNVNLSH